MKSSFLHTGKTLSLLIIVAILLSACGSDLWGSYDSFLTPSPQTAAMSPDPTKPVLVLSPSTPTSSPVFTATALPLNATALAPTSTPSPISPTPPIPTGEPGPLIPYTSQSGDSLKVVAIHFAVDPAEITASVPLPATGFINPGTLMFIPARLSQISTTPSQRIRIANWWIPPARSALISRRM